MKPDSHMHARTRARTTIKVQSSNSEHVLAVESRMAEYCESGVFPRLVKYPTNLSVISFSKMPVWQVRSCQSRCSRTIVWNILSCFFMYVSVSNLHFPQMNLASEKPPEAVLEGVIFKIFLGDHAPRPPYRLWRALHAIPHPLWKFGWTGFFLLPTALQCRKHSFHLVGTPFLAI